MKRKKFNSMQKKARRGFKGYPVATVAHYGPNATRVTKIAIGIVLNESDEVAELKRWYSTDNDTDIRFDYSIERRIIDFIREHKVRSVVSTERIMGCPHEEGIDYPEGGVCPECPFWASRDRFTGKIIK